MEFQPYIRKPFEVEAIEITEENIKEVSKMIGKLHFSDEGVPFIDVDPKKVPSVTRVWPGYWLTKVGNSNLRCFTKKIFNSQFQPSSDEIAEWVRWINGQPSKKAPQPQEGMVSDIA